MSKRHDSAMAEQLKKAGVAQWSALAMTAYDALRKRNGDFEAALADFTAAVANDADLLAELARGYFRDRADDMKQNGAGGRILIESPVVDATSTKTTAGHSGCDALKPVARPSSANRSGGGHEIAVAQMTTAVPAREPSAADRQAAAVVALSAARSVLDSFKVRDGRSIGDVTWKEVETMRATNVREAAVLRQIQKRVAHADGNARIRDLIGADELARMVQKAAEVADAA